MGEERPAKRFKYQSYQATLKEVHPRTALNQNAFNQEISDNSSHFAEAIDQWRELNLTPAFIKFADSAAELSGSMALLLHNWERVVEKWLLAVESADDEALKALLSLLQALTHDLRTTLAPRLPDLLDRLLSLLPRSLSAPTLSTLLESFSAVFKYVVIPTEAAEETWSLFADVIPKCNPEVQRMVAEMWGSMLRRMKVSAREACSVAIVSASDPDVGAWTMVSACKSVSQTLHTTTASMFPPVIRHYLDCEDPQTSFTVLRRSFTALAHHCKNPEQYTPTVEYAIQQLVSADHGETERSRRLLELLTVPSSVRQGSRLSQQQLSTLVTQLQSVPLCDELHDAVLKLTTACLTAGEMSLWLGPGRKIIKRVWERPALALELCGTLGDLGWGGWKMIALPHVLKKTAELLDSHTEKTLELLCALYKQGRLEGIDTAWKNKLQKWVDQRFSSWRSTPEKMLELNQVLTLSPLLPSLSPLVIHIIDVTLEASDPETEFTQTSSNSAWLLGSCFETLSLRPSSEWSTSVDLKSWTRTIITKWAWSGCCLEGLVSLLGKSPSVSSPISLDDIYPSLQQSLLSHSRALRLSVLRLITSSAMKSTPSTLETSKKVLSGEEVSLDVQGVRERVLKITRLAQVLVGDDVIGVDIALRWLIAQLKINLRPLWKPAAEALATLSQRFGDQIWKLIFEEVRQASEGESSYSSPSWMSDLPDGDLDPISEDEKTWRDPSAHKLRSSITLWTRGSAAERAIVQAQIVSDRFDSRSYEMQLLAALGECSSLAEKHSRDLIPLFLSLAPPEDPTRMPKHKLIAWLELLSKFNNPKALRSSEDVHRIYLTLVSHPDRPLQRLALSCLLTYKSPHLLPKKDKLTLLLDDTRWRDELTTLELTQIDPSDRAEFVDVLTRLLFGVMLEKRGRSRGADRRAAVLSVLNGCSDEELELLADLMLKPLRRGRDRYVEGVFRIEPMTQDVSDKQMLGFLALLEDVLRNMGARIVKLWPALLGTLLDITAHAQGRISGLGAEAELPSDEAEDDQQEEEDTKENGVSRTVSTIRQHGLKRLADFFRSPIVFDFSPYMKAGFEAFISPRLAAFATENTQSPSALMEIFFVWSSRPEYTPLLCGHDDRVLPQVYNCLIATSVKEPVIAKVFDIVDHLLVNSAEDTTTLDTCLKPHVSLLLTNLSILVERTKGVNTITDPIGRRQISILSQIAPWLTDSGQASTLLGLFTPILRKPSRLVPEKLKVDIVTILQSLFPLIPELSMPDSAVYVKTYSLLSFLFQNLRSRPGRLALLDTFKKLADINVSLQPLVALLVEFNAYSKRRIDEPDFDRRLSAFNELNESRHSVLSSQDWLPIIYNMLHFIQDPEELTIRSSASQAMKRFADLVADGDASYEFTFLKVLYPGLKNGLRTKSELVRAEILSIISHAVEKCTRITSLQEMRVLLANGDEEANFFNNIHHVQVHRRTRAIRRLVEFCDEGHLRSATLTDVFIPLLANFIQSASSIDHHLANEAILATGRMAKHLGWGSYYALVQQYLRLSKQRDAAERVYVRTIVAILDNFHFSMETEVKESESAAAEQEPQELDEEDLEQQQVAAKVASQKSHIADVVNSRLLPALLQHLEKRDETEDSLRIPIAIGVIQVALHLPERSRETQVSRLLTVLSQVLRSKSQETRDLTRETICKIAIILGPAYLHIVIREMRAALLRGPHLHVLAFSTHAVLVHVTSNEHASRFHTLDDCVNDVAHISSEVIFGESGKDLLAEEFKTKMREVRASTSKGFDSFATIAKFITPPKISSLLLPIRNILHETETLRVMQQVEDLLRRIAGGLNANAHLKPVDVLSLCHTLLSQNSKFLKQSPDPKPSKGKKKGKDDRLVQMKRKAGPDMDHFANSSFRFVVFGLELFNTAHRRSRFDFQDSAVIASLEPMVVAVGNTLYSNQQQVIIPGLKAASAIVKCPLKSIEKSLTVFVRQIIEIIRQVGSTDSDVVQNAFKSLASILRDQPKAQVKEKDLIFLLELLGPDLEEPTRQQAVFTMLRAIVARKFVVPEIYDLMDKTSEVMVTNQSSQVQELARGVLLQFLLEYPQGKGRLRNHMTFLAKNLSYVHESGRRSVMELLNAVLSKFNPDLLREYSDLLFVALVMVIANDESAKCREMASEIIKGLFARLQENQRRVMLSHVHSWAVQHTQPQLCRVSSQVYRIIIDFLQQDVAQHAQLILDDLNGILAVSAKSLDEASYDDDADLDVEWQIPYHALNALTKLLESCPDLTSEDDKVKWPVVVSHLLFPHAWTRAASCRLLGTLFSAVPVAAPIPTLPEDSPFSRVGMEDVAKKLCLQLRSTNLDAALGVQVVKNLFYIGKSFAVLESSLSHPEVEDDAEESDEEDEEDNGEGDGAEPGDNAKHPLSWLFSKLSYQARSAHIARRNKSSSPEGWHHQPASVLKWFAAMVSHLEPAQVEKYLMHMLAPVYRITEDDTIRDQHLDELKTLGVELQDLIQSKVGTTKFADVYNRIRQNVVGVRRERRTQRAVQTAANPAAAFKRKQQRNVAKKDGRKRKNSVFAESRGKIKRRREE
ncbi:U3 snoRNP protein [Steccherinum ochraceum]|uniref:U3 snoRNP protein n=1 Tax=Steccherinum ochraceum TaxID=92696 RepID=A0A4R0RC43_9APHY|nr:U3 snoRNP protein [Steccherinum ochraceum]